MLGAILGDIAGSWWEFESIKRKDFDLLSEFDEFTDDSVMTLAIANSFLECKSDYSDLGDVAIKNMREFGRKYPNAGYAGMFFDWLFNQEDPKPYNSYGNGAAMRVSSCGIVAKSIEEAKLLSRKVTEVTHNHPEGLKGAESVAVAIFLAKSGMSQLEIKEYINKNYYPMNFTLDEIRDSYRFDVSCQGSVPQAIMAFLEAKDFEDALRNAVSLGGDSDTQSAIAGSIAEYHFGIPEDLRNQAYKYLPDDLLRILHAFESKYGRKMSDVS